MKKKLIKTWKTDTLEYLIDSALQTMWIERTTYITAYRFPGILKWFEVKSVSVVRSSPVAQNVCYFMYFSISMALNNTFLLAFIPARLAGGDQSFGECHRNHGDDQ